MTTYLSPTALKPEEHKITILPKCNVVQMGSNLKVRSEVRHGIFVELSVIFIFRLSCSWLLKVKHCKHHKQMQSDSRCIVPKYFITPHAFYYLQRCEPGLCSNTVSLCEWNTVQQELQRLNISDVVYFYFFIHYNGKNRVVSGHDVTHFLCSHHFPLRKNILSL